MHQAEPIRSHNTQAAHTPIVARWPMRPVLVAPARRSTEENRRILRLDPHLTRPLLRFIQAVLAPSSCGRRTGNSAGPSDGSSRGVMQALSREHRIASRWITGHVRSADKEEPAILVTCNRTSRVSDSLRVPGQNEASLTQAYEEVNTKEESTVSPHFRQFTGGFNAQNCIEDNIYLYRD
jgi:hypothetical protein